MARYADGECVAELDPRGDHGFADVDLERVTAFELHPVDPTSGRSSYCVLVDPHKGQVPIFFRTRATGWLLAGGEPETVMTCIGRQQTVADQTLSVYVFLDEQGHVVISDERLS